jgi:hypothetical protein
MLGPPKLGFWFPDRSDGSLATAVQDQPDLPDLPDLNGTFALTVNLH